MNSTAHTASVLEKQRAAQLDRENELRRRHIERAVTDSVHRPGPVTVVVHWLTKALHHGSPTTSH
jgi:hypothetical protein